ncbi:DUF1793-domain-containing protein [Sistotremastrum niveocremeum HHB9708]|uniref:DUF1793-domain-containing protein n=1 Tax=Sistotremastrum niveocremeum HHB9708 TaxID=1314777 RepID=A0A164UDC6_9AGAM|nr:DUF1793-domain-containing protein [Sistotremastrum niveocremeum HHB9708]
MVLVTLGLLSLLGLHVNGASAQIQTPLVPWEASPFHPPSIPLAVRSPFLNCWISGGNASMPLSNQWPTFWTGPPSNLGWTGYVRVDGTAYRWLGAYAEGQQANQTKSSFTATQSLFVLEAGPVELTATFISPIEPMDLIRQSMPFSYLTVSVRSLDGASHNVQVYSDISSEWTSGDRSLTVAWLTEVSNNIVHQVQLAPQASSFAIDDSQSQGSTVFYATSNGDGVTYQTGSNHIVRQTFIQNGTLQNSQDNDFRGIYQDNPVFGLSVDLASIMEPTSPVVFALGLSRDPAVQYAAGPETLQTRSLFYLSQFSNATTAIQYFLSDYPRAMNASMAFDQQLVNAASATSTQYAEILALATRQAFSGIEITTSKDESGAWNTSDVLVFLATGSGPTNTLDILYAMSPIFLYTNPALLGYILEVDFQYMRSGSYQQAFAPHDLGNYPDVIGNQSPLNSTGVEESANLLIMSLAMAQASGNGGQLVNYYDTLKGLADYLVDNALYPGNQMSTDMAFLPRAPNSTLLSLKGIIAIKAMAEVRSALNITDTEPSYSDIASSYISQWQQLAIDSKGDLLSSYDNLTSSTLGYDLYPDLLLGTNLVSSDLYSSLTTPTKWTQTDYGVTLDSTLPGMAKVDWTLFLAATAGDLSTRSLLISLVHNYLSAGQSHVPFGDFYNIYNGESRQWQARPVVGGLFSILALNQTKPITVPPSTSVPSGPSAQSSTAVLQSTTKPGPKKSTALATFGSSQNMMVLLPTVVLIECVILLYF